MNGRFRILAGSRLLACIASASASAEKPSRNNLKFNRTRIWSRGRRAALAYLEESD